MHVAVGSGRPAERSLAFSVAVELFEPLWRAPSSPALRAELADGPARAAVGLLDALSPSAPARRRRLRGHAGDVGARARLAATAGRDGEGAREGTERAPAGSPSSSTTSTTSTLRRSDCSPTPQTGSSSSPVTIIAGCRADVESVRAGGDRRASHARRESSCPSRWAAGAGAALVGSLLPGRLAAIRQGLRGSVRGQRRTARRRSSSALRRSGCRDLTPRPTASAPCVPDEVAAPGRGNGSHACPARRARWPAPLRPRTGPSALEQLAASAGLSDRRLPRGIRHAGRCGRAPRRPATDVRAADRPHWRCAHL